MDKILKTTAILFFTISFIGALYFLLIELVESKQASCFSPNPYEETCIEKFGETNTNIVNWQYWKDINPDLVAWIVIPGTDINHPIVMAPRNDPNYYLNHDFYKKVNVRGCPFIEYQNSSFEKINYIVYGHNIKRSFGKVFNDLTHYKDIKFAKENKSAYILTPEQNFSLDVFAVDTVYGTKLKKEENFKNDADFYNYIQKIYNQSDIQLENPTNPNFIVTLCTCSYFIDPKNERTVVYLTES